jgi:hypothetical protein
MSEPVAGVAEPAARAAADPPLEPPGEYAVCHGLRLTPHSFDQVTGAQENSGVVVRACTMPPASRIRSVARAGRAGHSGRSPFSVAAAITRRAGFQPGRGTLARSRRV